MTDQPHGPLYVLAMLTDAFLSRHGCFPLDRATPEQREWNQAMTLAYALVGQPGTMMRTMAVRAAEKEGEDWVYLATCIEMHADKFPIPDHMRNYAKKLRELGLEGAGVRELATHLADIVTHGTTLNRMDAPGVGIPLHFGVDLSSLEDISVITHPPGYVPTMQTAPPIPTVPDMTSVDVTFPEAKPECYKVVETDNFNREGPGHDDKWICEHAIPFVAAKALADALNQQYATETGSFWAAVVPADYKLQIFEP